MVAADNWNNCELVDLPKPLLFILMLALCSVVRSQNTLDLLTISGRYGTPAPYDSLIEGDAQETGGMVSLAAPIQFNEQTIWYNGLTYFNFNVRNNEALPESVANPIELHGFILRTGLYQKFGDGKGIQLLFSPRLMTDMKNIDSDHFQFGGIAIYENKFKEHLTMGFGVLYNQEKFGPNVVPLINLNWQVSEKWWIGGLLPIYSKIRYQASERSSLGITHFGLITSYQLGAEELNGDYIERRSIDLSLFYRYRMFGDFHLEGRVGHTVGRAYEQYASDQMVDLTMPLTKIGDDRTINNVNFGDGLILDLRFVYSIEIPE